MRKTKFNMCDGKNIYEGYTYGNDWNGWECPYFTKEVADKMEQDHSDEIYYEKRLDAFIVVDSGHGKLSGGAKDLVDRILKYKGVDITKDGTDEYDIKNIETILIALDFEVYRGEDKEVNGETLHLYDIGNCCWMWDEVMTCDWCGEIYEESELKNTDLGKLCDRCIAAIRSRGESITIVLED